MYIIIDDDKFQTKGFNKCGISVPNGFISNGVSFPSKFMKHWLEFDQSMIEGAILHDYLYTTKYLSRKASDLKFKEAMKLDGVNNTLINIAYYLVRGFGGMFYGR